MDADHGSICEVVAVRGLVIPVAWDDTGKVVGISIATADEGQYFVEESEILEQLVGQLREEVVVRGVLQEAGGKKLLVRCRLSGHHDKHD
jgi:hypothetical protein